MGRHPRHHGHHRHRHQHQHHHHHHHHRHCHHQQHHHHHHHHHHHNHNHNHKFEKFITLKIQTDELEKIQATSADNINMMVDSTVNWRIVDVEVAATMAA